MPRKFLLVTVTQGTAIRGADGFEPMIVHYVYWLVIEPSPYTSMPLNKNIESDHGPHSSALGSQLAALACLREYCQH